VDRVRSIHLDPRAAPFINIGPWWHRHRTPHRASRNQSRILILSRRSGLTPTSPPPLAGGVVGLGGHCEKGGTEGGRGLPTPSSVKHPATGPACLAGPQSSSERAPLMPPSQSSTPCPGAGTVTGAESSQVEAGMENEAKRRERVLNLWETKRTKGRGEN
jgi:hypothetical protein